MARSVIRWGHPADKPFANSLARRPKLFSRCSLWSSFPNGERCHIYDEGRNGAAGNWCLVSVSAATALKEEATAVGRPTESRGVHSAYRDSSADAIASSPTQAPTGS